MYEMIKSAIAHGNYKLADMRRKINKLFLQGGLTEEQLDELLSLASGGASADAERPETLALVQTLANEIDALKERVNALENKGNEGGVEDGADAPEPELPPAVYPDWKPWDGISKDYQYGAIVAHIGKLWQSVFAGQNVWEPGTAGTETLWVEYAPNAVEQVEETTAE